MSQVQTGTVSTKVPARLDRLPWSRWHWMLIPSRHRGVVDIVINGTYWEGAAFGALLTVPATSALPVAFGWRVCFALVVVLGLAVLFAVTAPG